MIKVLHVFAPAFGLSFSGHNKRWARSFKAWTDSKIRHSILLPFDELMLDAGSIENVFGQADTLITFTSNHHLVWAYKVLCNLIRHRNQYDVLHVHTHGWGGLLAAPLSNLLGKPCLRELNRMGSDNPSVVRANSLGWLKLWCLKKYDHIYCISNALRDDCLRHGFASDQVHVILNPVDIDIFCPPNSALKKIRIRRSLALPQNAIVILFVGSVIYRKGIDVLIEALMPLMRDNPNLFAIIAGPNSRIDSMGVDDNFVTTLRTKIDLFEFSDRFLFVGRIDDDLILSNYYRAADIFVFPTREEGLGNVLLEAMSSSLPCIASHLPGVTDLIIQDDENGLLIPIAQSQALADCLSVLISDKDFCLRLGENARQRVIQQHSFDHWQGRLARVYELMLQETTPTKKNGIV